MKILPPDSRRTRWVAFISLAITASIALALVHQRAGIGPFEIPVYRHLILFQDYYVLAPFIGILVAALFAPVRALGAHAALWCGRNVWTVVVVTAAALAIGAHSVYHTHPLSLDEYAVVFQSKIFVEGRATGQFPPELLDWLIPKFFQGRFIKPSYETGEVISIYWPGFSLLLSPFTALGVPWLLNPLIGAATLVVMHRIAHTLFDDVESAGYAVLLTLASPAVTINAVSYYSMPAHLLVNGMFVLLLLKPTPLRAVGAGLIGSFALILHNPAPHLLFALPWIAWLATRPDRWRLLGFLAVGYLPSLPIGWGWAIFTEGLGRSTIADPGGAAAAASVMSRMLSRVLGWTSSTGTSSHLLDLCKLWLWAVPGLVAVAALGAWRQRKDRGPWLALGGSALATYFGYFLVSFDQGHGWGFRYFHSAWLVLPLFAVCAMNRAPETPGFPKTASTPPSTLAGYLAACAMLSLAVLTPFRALQVEQFIARHLAQRPVAARGDARITIINSSHGYYAWDLIQNDPYLRGSMITLVSRGPEGDRSMMAAVFPQYQLLGSDPRGTVWGTAGP